MTTNNLDATPPIDVNFLADFSDDPAEVRELVGMYLEQTEERIANLGKAVAAGAAPDVMRLSHTCAGSSGMYGMTVIAPLFRELEQNAKAGDLSQATALHDRICNEFSRIKAFWQAYQQSSR